MGLQSYNKKEQRIRHDLMSVEASSPFSSNSRSCRAAATSFNREIAEYFLNYFPVVSEH